MTFFNTTLSGFFKQEDGQEVSTDITAELVNLYAKYSAWS